MDSLAALTIPGTGTVCAGSTHQCSAQGAPVSSGRFDFCDDITHGYNTTQRRTYDALRKAVEAYFIAYSGNEIDLSGTASGAFEIHDRERSGQTFLVNLKALEADQLPAIDAKQARRVAQRCAGLAHRPAREPAARPATLQRSRLPRGQALTRASLTFLHSLPAPCVPTST